MGHITRLKNRFTLFMLLRLYLQVQQLRQMSQEGTHTHTPAPTKASPLEEYSDVHRGLLQFLINVKSTDKEELMKVFKKLYLSSLLLEKVNGSCGYETPDTDVEAIKETKQLIDQDDPDIELDLDQLTQSLNLINENLIPMDMLIVESINQDYSNSINICLINTRSSESIKLSTSYTEKEIEIINQLIEEMFENPYDDQNNLTHSLKNFEALNVAKRNLASLTESQMFLKNLELNGWLEIHNNKSTLSARSLAELKQFLISKYELRSEDKPNGTVSVCKGCNELITRGLYCSQEDCYVRFHKSCKDLYASAHSSDNCPNIACSMSLENMIEFD